MALPTQQVSRQRTSPQLGMDLAEIAIYGGAFNALGENMHRHLGLVLALALATTTASATDEMLSNAEFEQMTSSPFVATNAKSGLVVEIELKSGGQAVARRGYNDVGSWHKQGDSAYCVRWNKQRLDDRCAQFVRHDGKLALTASPGEDVAWWVTGAQK